MNTLRPFTNVSAQFGIGRFLNWGKSDEVPKHPDVIESRKKATADRLHEAKQQSAHILAELDGVENPTPEQLERLNLAINRHNDAANQYNNLHFPKE